MKSAQCSISDNFKRCCHQLNGQSRTAHSPTTGMPFSSNFPVPNNFHSQQQSQFLSAESAGRLILVPGNCTIGQSRFQQLANLATGPQFQFPVLGVGSVFLKLQRNLLQFWKRFPQKCQETPKFKGCRDIFTSVYCPHR